MQISGHGRCQQLPGTAVDKSDSDDSQEPGEFERNNPGSHIVKFDLKSRAHRVQGFLDPIKQSSEQNLNATSVKVVTGVENYWPNGNPPRAPRNFSCRSGLPPNRRQSNARERYETLVTNNSTSTGMRRPSSSPSLHDNDDDDDFTIRLAKKVINDVDRSPIRVKTTESISSGPSSIQNLSRVGNGTYATHRSQRSRTRSSPEAQSYGNSDLLEYPATSIERSHTGRAVSPSVQKIPEAVRRSHRSGRAASVVSVASSTAAMSSMSSVSSHSGQETCHKCKRAPSARKLKGCFECTRYYHSRCADPPDG